jgi:hypothetical protein
MRPAREGFYATIGRGVRLLTDKEITMDDKLNTATRSPNEGEGNKTATREYNEAQKRFAQSGKVEEKAREAEQALDGPEKDALKRAEEVGKGHSAGEDPAVTRKK